MSNFACDWSKKLFYIAEEVWSGAKYCFDVENCIKLGMTLFRNSFGGGLASLFSLSTD